MTYVNGGELGFISGFTMEFGRMNRNHRMMTIADFLRSMDIEVSYGNEHKISYGNKIASTYFDESIAFEKPSVEDTILEDIQKEFHLSKDELIGIVETAFIIWEINPKKVLRVYKQRSQKSKMENLVLSRPFEKWADKASFVLSVTGIGRPSEWLETIFPYIPMNKKQKLLIDVISAVKESKGKIKYGEKLDITPYDMTKPMRVVFH